MSLVIDSGQLSTVVAVIVSVASTSLAWSIRSGRKVAPLVKLMTQFVQDWSGTPARPGYPAQPGMAERTYGLELATKAQDATLRSQAQAIDEIRRELVANGGGSLRDQVRRIEQAQRTMSVAVGAPLPLPLPAAELAGLAAAIQRHPEQVTVPVGTQVELSPRP